MMKTLSPTVITLPWRQDAAEHYFAPISQLPWAMLLHSGNALHPYNRFDILVADPITTLITRAKDTTVRTAHSTTVSLNDPLQILQSQLEALSFHPLPDPDLPFQGGALGLFGSVDANRGDAQLGWDTDQFPNSVEENALVMYEILKAGGFTTGGLNFDAKVRRQSTDKYDLFYGHIGAMDTMALALKVAARMIEDGQLDQRVAKRYAGWNGELGQQILKGQMSLTDIAQYAEQHNLAPVHKSGHQEQLENLVNHYLFDK
ncbi:MAG TPA: hypothetical protein DCM34_10785 [Salmonella bongori]|nr:hypothetical protein [Salmonella bongori]